MSNELEWNESRYFNLHDHSSGVTVFMRIGNKPNKNEKSMFLFVIEKGRVCGMRNAVPCDDDRRSCSGLGFEELPDGSWRIRYSGPLFDTASEAPAPIMSSMDLVWRPVNPLMDYHDCVDSEGEELSSKTASEHFEQFGLVSGSVVVGGSSYDIDATGERDYSEGVRDWGAPKMWMWLNSVYGRDLGFNATKLCTEGGDVDAGFVGTPDANDPVVRIEVDVGYDGGIPSSYKMRMHGRSGRAYDVEARILAHAALPMQGSNDMMLIETISETKMEGRVGYGIAEFLVRARRRCHGPAARVSSAWPSITFRTSSRDLVLSTTNHPSERDSIFLRVSLRSFMFSKASRSSPRDSMRLIDVSASTSTRMNSSGIGNSFLITLYAFSYLSSGR